MLSCLRYHKITKLLNIPNISIKTWIVLPLEDSGWLSAFHISVSDSQNGVEWPRVSRPYCSLWKVKVTKRSVKMRKDPFLTMSYGCLHIMSGCGVNTDVSCDQNSGMEPRICTTDVIGTFWPSGTSLVTICSISTSLATLPASFIPRLKYLHINKERRRCCSS